MRSSRKELFRGSWLAPQLAPKEYIAYLALLEDTMAKFRVETVDDLNTGLIYAELYYPDDAVTPTEVTDPIFATHEEAAASIIAAFRKSQPDHPVKVTR